MLSDLGYRWVWRVQLLLGRLCWSYCAPHVWKRCFYTLGRVQLRKAKPVTNEKQEKWGFLHCASTPNGKYVLWPMFSIWPIEKWALLVYSVAKRSRPTSRDICYTTVSEGLCWDRTAVDCLSLFTGLAMHSCSIPLCNTFLVQLKVLQYSVAPFVSFQSRTRFFQPWPHSCLWAQTLTWLF